jgi:hypothetical protein
MRALKIIAAVVGVLLLSVVIGYFSTVSTMPLGQPRLLHVGHYRVLMETVPSNEAGWWAQPIYAETARNGVLKRDAAGRSIRIGRLNFYAVGR